MITSKINAQEFIFSPNCQEAYKCFMSMKINAGKQLLANELLTNKKNILPLVLINYEDFISLSFNENPAEYKIRKLLLNKRLDIVETGNKKSPYYLFSKALLFFQWSLIQIKYGDYWNAAWDFRKAYHLFKENKSKHPDFTPNNIYLGVQESVMSTIPSGYKWASSVLGLKGNMSNGMLMLKNYNNSSEHLFKEESKLYYIYLKNYLENDIEGANQLISTYQMDTKNNQLFVFMASNLALNNKKAQVAETILLKRNKSADYLSFPMLDYELGNAKMKKLDFSAIQYFQKFIQQNKGNFYIKDATYSIALCYYLQDDLKSANEYLTKVKTIGKTESDADKQALKRALKGIFPDKLLLKTRLLNDGGYNAEALKIATAILPSTLKTDVEQLELIYRIARIYDDLEQFDKALLYYNQTIERGINSSEYFAARACLQAGYIYEKKGLFAKAKAYYNKELSLGEHDFKNSLDQRAKSSLNRLK
jgi:tetratricopeptide (TPR) repeat protein